MLHFAVLTGYNLIMRKLFSSITKHDIILISALLIFSIAALFFLPKTGDTVQVFHDGEIVYEAALSKNCEFQIFGKYTNIIKIENGKAGYFYSDCPNADCVHIGMISAGMAACAPNGTILRIISEAEVDVVVR